MLVRWKRTYLMQTIISGWKPEYSFPLLLYCAWFCGQWISCSNTFCSCVIWAWVDHIKQEPAMHGYGPLGRSAFLPGPWTFVGLDRVRCVGLVYFFIVFSQKFFLYVTILFFRFNTTK